MSMPNIPNINPDIKLEIKDTISMLLSSIALEEIGLSHIINAEAEKIQYVLGTLNEQKECRDERNVSDLLKVNNSVNRTLNSVLQNQMLLNMKLQDTIDLYSKYLESDNSGSCQAEFLGER